jgi:hypothetical protein
MIAARSRRVVRPVRLPVLLALVTAGCAGSVPPGPSLHERHVATVLSEESIGREVRVVRVSASDPALREALEAEAAAVMARRGYVLDAGSPWDWEVTVSSGLAREPMLSRSPMVTTKLPAGDVGLVVRQVVERDPPVPGQGTVSLVIRKHGIDSWEGNTGISPAGSREAAKGALRGLAWNLPVHPGAEPPEFTPLAPDSIVPFYRARCEGRPFFCPLSPWPVRFPDLEAAYHRGGAGLKWADTRNTHQHEDPTLLPAVIAVLEMPGAVLPRDVPNRPDPADPDRWRRIRLGAELKRADTGDPLYLLVDLKGDERGLGIDRTRPVDVFAWREFREEAAAWEKELAEHYGRAAR